MQPPAGPDLSLLVGSAARHIQAMYNEWQRHIAGGGGRIRHDQWQESKTFFESIFNQTCLFTSGSLEDEPSSTGRFFHNSVVFKSPVGVDAIGIEHFGDLNEKSYMLGYWNTPLILIISSENHVPKIGGVLVNENHPNYTETMSESSLRTLFPYPFFPVRKLRQEATIGSSTWLLKNFKNLILEGVPGTGKTHAFQEIVNGWTSQTGKAPKQHQMTFHPTTAYEEFMIGIRPVQPEGDGPPFDVVDGFFKKIVDEAKADPTIDHIVLLDEFNRANIPKVMGDLLTLLEPSKRARYEQGSWHGFEVTLPYQRSGATEENKFFVPENIYIVATLNTTDRSVAPMDSALRRRFVFSRIEPMAAEQLMNSLRQQRSEGDQTTLPDVLTQSVHLWSQLNEWFQENIGPDGMLGHSYLFELSKICSPSQGNTGVIIECWNALILPQINDILTNNDMIHHLNSFNEAIETYPIAGMKLIAEAIGSGINRMPFLRFETATEENPVETIDESESE